MADVIDLATKLQNDVKQVLKNEETKTDKNYSKWTLHSDELYVRGAEATQINDTRIKEQINKLPSYKNLVDALSRDKKWSKLFGKVISIHSQSSTVNIDSYIYQVLLTRSRKPHHMKKARDKFFEELVASDYNVRLITPILGLQVGRKIRLSNETNILRQNDNDVIKCLDWGLLPTFFPNENSYWISSLHPGISFLISEYKHPIISDRQLNKKESSDFKAFEDRHEWIKNGLQMTCDLSGFEVNVGKTIVTGNYLTIPAESIRDLEAIPHIWRRDNALIINGSLGKQLNMVFGILNNSDNKSNKMLRLASNRLALARQRKSDEDAFLDLMIACEAFYMYNESDHIDIGYKLRIRAATWYSTNEYTKKEIMQLFSIAYGVRSRIAHGEELKRVGKFRGQELTIRDLFGMVEKILKTAVLRYIQLLDKKETSYVHQWEDIVIGE